MRLHILAGVAVFAAAAAAKGPLVGPATNLLAATKLSAEPVRVTAYWLLPESNGTPKRVSSTYVSLGAAATP